MIKRVNESIYHAWREAANDLKIKVEAPFQVTLENGEEIIADVYLPEFDAVFISLDRADEAVKLRRLGYWVSEISADAYLIYNRRLFIDTLNDTGWKDTLQKPPEWYTGDAWQIERQTGRNKLRRMSWLM